MCLYPHETLPLSFQNLFQTGSQIHNPIPAGNILSSSETIDKQVTDSEAINDASRVPAVSQDMQLMLTVMREGVDNLNLTLSATSTSTANTIAEAFETFKGELEIAHEEESEQESARTWFVWWILFNTYWYKKTKIVQIPLEGNTVSIHLFTKSTFLRTSIIHKGVKPVYATLRRKGHLNVGYIDDSYLQGDNVSVCNDNITDTIDLFTRLGLIIHPHKSVLPPTQATQARTKSEAPINFNL